MAPTTRFLHSLYTQNLAYTAYIYFAAQSIACSNRYVVYVLCMGNLYIFFAESTSYRSVVKVRSRVAALHSNDEDWKQFICELRNLSCHEHDTCKRISNFKRCGVVPVWYWNCNYVHSQNVYIRCCAVLCICRVYVVAWARVCSQCTWDPRSMGAPYNAETSSVCVFLLR